MTVSMALAAVLTGSAPVQAARPDLSFSGSDCPAQSLCLFRDPHFTGGGIAVKAGAEIADLGYYGFNDQMSSWSNDSGVVCIWWVHGLRQGDYHDMRRGYRVNVLPNEDNTASAVACYI
ncbi:peptidase inhibitor family I36 protein [Streptomyces tsukubensis]|uniref:peptidase inhibitor family I36 protein n=1 Tax=Streptomyces tsukubensis TaxID=83656 RepID=UPI00344EE62A